MRILDKYILRKIVSAYLLTLLSLFSLYIITDVFSHLPDYLKNTPPFYSLLQYYFYYLPFIFLKVSPFSVLISVLYTLGELNKNNEIISMRALGISIFKLSLPIIFFSLFLSSLAIYIQEKTLLSSQKKCEEIRLKYLRRDKIKEIKEKNNLAFHYGDQTFFIAKFLPRKSLFKDVMIFQENKEGNIEEKIVCRTIYYQNGKWVASDVISYHLNKQGEILGSPHYLEKREIDLPSYPEELILEGNLFGKFSTLKRLKEEIKRLKTIKATRLLSNLTVEYHTKIVECFSHFFLVIGILPLALAIRKRKVALSSLGVSLLFGFSYYLLFSVSIALGKTGVLIPSFSAWLSPLFFSTVGIVGFLFTK